MKLLNRYILAEHIAPFIFAFCLITFLLIIDLVPKIIDQVIDKDLPFTVVLELVALNLAWMLALSVPMSVLVATLMAFGRLTSDFEVTAMKASGINLIRILIPLLVAGGVITFLMIQFNDKILPDLNKRSRQLQSDVSVVRPTLVFRPGVFLNDIPGFLVLLDDIDHSTSRVDGVHITDIKDKKRPQIIVADHGFMRVMPGGTMIEFDLYDGEMHKVDVDDPDEYHRVKFDQQTIYMPIEGRSLVRTDREFRTDREMRIEELADRVRAAEAAIAPFESRISRSLEAKFKYLYADSFETSLPESIPDSASMELTRQDAAMFVRQFRKNVQQIEGQVGTINKYRLELYKKYSIPAASLAFVLIGAPLGVLSRKGGMGAAITISILLFIVYWAFLIGGEDLSDRGLMTPFWAMWSANILLGAIGCYLIYIVMTERPVFSFFRRRGGKKK
jgi:lipopolysaccharide export system permease protein